MGGLITCIGCYCCLLTLKPKYVELIGLLANVVEIGFLIWGIALLRFAFPILLVRVGNSPLMYYLFTTYFQNLKNTILNCIFVGNFIDLFKKTDNEK